jgi:hypothetical protein
MLLNAETGKWFDRWANARASKERKTRIFLFDEGRSLIRWLIGARSKKTILRLNRDGDEWKTDWSLPCPRPTQFLGADDYSVATHTRVGSDEFFVLYTLANGKKWHSKSGPMCWVYREGRIYILIDTGEMEVLRPGKGSLESLTIPVDLDPQATFLIFDLKESGIGVKVGDTVYGLDPMTFSLQWKFELPEDFHEDSVPRRTRSGAIAVHGKKGVSLFLPSSNARDAGEETD